jgi:hypothetical protein
MYTNRKMATLALLSVVAFAAIMSGFLLSTQAADSTDTLGTETNVASMTAAGNFSDFLGWNLGGVGFGGHGPRGRPCGFGCFGPLQVSSEFEQTVTDIANNDTDVQNLLAEGYNVTAVKPIVSSVVDAEGYVTTKATSAVLLLQKDTSGAASVLVDVDQGKVTQIVILTRTVIDKT